MSVDDVVDILAVNLLGVIPDDEQIVISTNKGEPLAEVIPYQEMLISIFADGYLVTAFLLQILMFLNENLLSVYSEKTCIKG